ncbi:MAG: hypothetical protein LBB08_02965 [Rickettsiales bacterium]|jgi:hypothetical protein|nr:hypothetical protein [Rickettsiales bacterium]
MKKQGVMRIRISAFSAAFLAAVLPAVMIFAPAFAAAREGMPSYYQGGYPQQYQSVPNRYGQNLYIGNQASRKIIGQQAYSYQVPRAPEVAVGGAMTPNGVAVPPSQDQWGLKLTVFAGRKFADFQFETGVQSILEWDDMSVNEIGARVEKGLNLRGFDAFIFGEYSQGVMSDGGLSMDYDLRPYDEKEPNAGIFTISMGDQSGNMQNIKLGVGARHIWDIAGWKISPVVGYQIFEHKLQMSNHIYPNPAVYLPLMTQYGEYVYSDESQNYYVVAPGASVQEGWYQVCMSPEDLLLALTDPSTHQPIVDENGGLLTTDYNPIYETLPWGVNAGECIVIGGDGLIEVRGVTHIYNTTWSGIYLGVEVEKQMTYVDKLRFYAQVAMPHYRSEGTWPNRTDWQQNPSFVDEGDVDALHYQAEMEYVYQFSDRLQLSLKASTDYFHIGGVGGELYVAGYQYYQTDEYGNYVLETDAAGNEVPILATQEPYTEKLTDSLKNATWQSFGLHIGVKYGF